MKRLFTTLIIITALIQFSSCSETSEPAPSLENTLWASYSHTSTITGAKVYKMLDFQLDNKVNYYYAAERQKQIGETSQFDYTFDGDAVKILSDTASYEGQVFGERLSIFQSQFELQ